MKFTSTNLEGINMAEKTKEEIVINEVTEEYLQDKLYDIRGYKVMHDADLD